MPGPEFTADDYVNPDAPEDELRLKPDHPRVRDHSYDCARSTQELDLWKGSLISTVMEPWGDYPDLAEIPENAVPGPELTLFVNLALSRGGLSDCWPQRQKMPLTSENEDCWVHVPALVEHTSQVKECVESSPLLSVKGGVALAGLLESLVMDRRTPAPPPGSDVSALSYRPCHANCDRNAERPAS
ncbi:hypothetical protein ACFC0C_41190 [Streptomyces sp. NPDC056178]|uniref:hypothetical protein n=1 Tax=unclassified Streptomyces TaxID=2593676 RepID=UPI0035DB1681